MTTVEPPAEFIEVVERYEVVRPDIDHIVTEDDTPLDNIFSEKQQRLLTEPLYSSWGGPGEGRGFLVAANVGVYSNLHILPLVPDVLLSIDVKLQDSLQEKANRTYFVWEFGKPPDVVIEIVSNKEGGEATRKLEDYARMRIAYYAIFDPFKLIQGTMLRCFELRATSYVHYNGGWFDNLGLGLTIWHGTFEGHEDTWLRWCDRDGNVISTGRERAEAERQRAERLAAKLRELGIEVGE